MTGTLPPHESSRRMNFLDGAADWYPLPLDGLDATDDYLDWPNDLPCPTSPRMVLDDPSDAAPTWDLPVLHPWVFVAPLVLECDGQFWRLQARNKRERAARRRS